MDFSEIPIIDLAGEAERLGARGLAERFGRICHDVGFAVVTNHGVPRELTDAAFARAADFFALPLERKMLIDKRRSRHFRGWEGEGAEYTNNRPDIREQIDFWTAHPPRAVDAEPKYLRLLGPNQWPPEDVAPGLQAAVEGWIDAVGGLADRLLGLMAVSLGLEEDHIRRAFGAECMSLCKVIRYPPTPAGQFGVNAHHDAGFLTILAVNDALGLEVENAAGDWIPVPVTPGGLVVNLGEILQKMTGNYFVATPHRVTTRTERQSMGYFHGPSLTMPFTPLPLDRRHADAVAASPRHRGAGFMIQPDEAAVGAADMSSPVHPDVYGEQLWNYFKRSYPENVLRHYPDD